MTKTDEAIWDLVININLKGAAIAYANITFDDLTVSGSGLNGPTGAGARPRPSR